MKPEICPQVEVGIDSNGKSDHPNRKPVPPGRTHEQYEADCSANEKVRGKVFDDEDCTAM